MKYLILLLLFYLTYKYAKYLLGSLAKSNTSGSNNSSSKVNVKYNPERDKKKFDDGEYIEYEEVK